MPLIIEDSSKIIEKLNRIDRLMPGLNQVFYQMVYKLADRLPFMLTPAKFVKFYNETVQGMNLGNQGHYPSDTLALLQGMLPQLAKAIFDDEFYEAVVNIRAQQNQQFMPDRFAKK